MTRLQKLSILGFSLFYLFLPSFALGATVYEQTTFNATAGSGTINGFSAVKFGGNTPSFDAPDGIGLVQMYGRASTTGQTVTIDVTCRTVNSGSWGVSFCGDEWASGVTKRLVDAQPIDTGNGLQTFNTATTVPFRSVASNNPLINYYYYFSMIVSGGNATFSGKSTPNLCVIGCGTGADFYGDPFMILYGYEEGQQLITTTQITYIKPLQNSTVATGTQQFRAKGFIADSDYEEGTYVLIRYAPLSSGQAAVGNPDNLFRNIELPVDGSGYFDVFQNGEDLTIQGLYQMETSINTPSIFNDVLNFFGFGQFATNSILSSTSTQFTVGQLTAFDLFVASTTGSLTQYLASSTISMASCNAWTSFDMADCLALLFIPQYQPIVQALSNFKNNFLSYAPWGYLTRFIVIMSGNARVALPDITVNIPIYGGDTLTFHEDPQDMFEQGRAALNLATESKSGDNMNFEELVRPMWQQLLAVMVILIIAFDLMRHRL